MSVFNIQFGKRQGTDRKILIYILGMNHIDYLGKIMQ